MQDELFVKTHVENDEFEEALMYYVYVEQDPEVRKALNLSSIKMQEEMRKAGLAAM